MLLSVSLMPPTASEDKERSVFSLLMLLTLVLQVCVRAHLRMKLKRVEMFSFFSPVASMVLMFGFFYLDALNCERLIE